LDKKKDVKTVVKAIEKKYGVGSILCLDNDIEYEAPHAPVGVISLDHALGIGGLPKGRIIEIFGPEMCGKTTIGLATIAEAQKTGGLCAFIDVEHSLDPTYSKKIGVNIEALLLSQPNSGEEALDIAQTLIESGLIEVIVIDSVAALVPKAEIEGNIGDAHIGLQARLMSQALRKLTPLVSKTNTCLIFINQLREKIGGFGFGSPETTPGGRALKFYASARLDVRKIGTLKINEIVVGGRTRVKVVKNKLAAPFRQAEFDILFEEGISKIGDLLDIAAEKDIVKQSGSWYSYGDTKLGQGRETAKTFLKENKEIRVEIEVLVKEILCIGEQGNGKTV
jgi:recombination protein RecA